MKSFKNFLNKSSKKSLLFFDSSFAETRKFPSEIKESSDKLPFWFGEGEKPKPKLNHHGVSYDSAFHDDEFVKPMGLTKEHEKAIYQFTQPRADKHNPLHVLANSPGSSSTINSSLRHEAGDQSSTKHKLIPSGLIKKGKDRLASVFSKENTNKKTIQAYGAVPARIGGTLLSKGKFNEDSTEHQGSGEHHIPGYSSASSSKASALEFGGLYHSKEHPIDNGDGKNDREHPIHIFHYHIDPGASVSAAHHSEWGENELIIKPSKITHVSSKLYSRNRTLRHPVWIHHVHVHND